MSKIIRVIVLSSLFLLSACSYFSKSPTISLRNKAYLSASSIPPINIPPGLSSKAFENQYPVSDRQYPSSEKTISLVPPGL